MDREWTLAKIFNMAESTADQQTTTQTKHPLLINFWASIEAWLRRDGVAIVLYAIATILMSYPIAFKLGGDWLAMWNIDTYMKIWDNWWLQNHAFNELSLNFTDLLFHPIGLDLSYHSISWTVAFLSWVLTKITDAITAYNLTILIALFSTAYAAYLLVRPFVKYGAAAWLAGAIYSYAPYHLAHSGGHPDLVHLAPIPLAVLLLYVAFTRKSVIAAVGAGLMIGFAGFTSLYIMVFALLTIGPILLFLLLENHRWSQPEILRIVSVFGITSVLLLSIRLLPILRDVSALTEAIESKYAAENNQTDLMSYVLPSQLNPLFAPYTSELSSHFGHMSSEWPAYLGIVPITLSIAALTWNKQRKIVLLWFTIGLMFVFLSLGPVLRFNGNLYDNFLLPARYLSWFPPIRAVGRPDYFVLGALLPVGILAAFGFDRLLIALEGRRRFQLLCMTVLPGLLLVEYWSGEFPGRPVNVNPFFERLSQEPDNFAIIQLPMGRSKAKKYLFQQTFHHKPIAEGLSGRTPVEAYQYIYHNPLLQIWSESESLDCNNLTWDRMMPALDQLVRDDFRYVIVHHRNPEILAQFANYFPLLEPFYQDSQLTVFRLADMLNQPPCQTIYKRVFDLPSPDIATSIQWDQKISLLGYDLPDVDPNAKVQPIKVYWQANEEMENSYVAYLHLMLKGTNNIVAQADVIPRGWTYPTIWWVKGEVVEDTIQLPVENVPPGSYELRIGWYDKKTGLRLTAESDYLQPNSDGSILLGVIDIRASKSN
jgi:hypothetical protein